MQLMKLVFWGAMTCLPVSVFACLSVTSLTERTLREECSAFSQAGMRECLGNHAEKSQKLLQQAEEAAGQKLSDWGEDAKYVRSAQTKLVTSAQKFIQYRDAQCAFTASLGGGAIGSALEIRRLACVAELNYRRAAQLNDAVSELPPK